MLEPLHQYYTLESSNKAPKKRQINPALAIFSAHGDEILRRYPFLINIENQLAPLNDSRYKMLNTQIDKFNVCD
ncbi:hypothetical protein [Daejeonella sp.]|uniref:hypothetical protein n=1 Tax=Daejeonella sp. TaxID=2805397 RepID=UPI00271CE291|nr:hypothetical protein [Daejeonella sp.]MDO8992841.1 hypothetical protein [Daejeonella sp.]MDP2414355.1 hypothetical protein [Daejeonella sp.]